MKFKKFLKSKISGQAVMEYVVISAAMAAIFFLGFVANFGDEAHEFSLFAKIKRILNDEVYDRSYQVIMPYKSSDIPDWAR